MIEGTGRQSFGVGNNLNSFKKDVYFAMITALIEEIQSLYGEIDRQVATFQIATGLRCRSGCGDCCPGAPIHAAVVEMLPLAASLVRGGVADVWLERLAAGGDTCVGFSSTTLAPDTGHCTFYAHRPIVCRLFGFAASRNRRGGLELSSCRLIKAEMPEAVARAAALLAANGPAPSLTAYTTRIFGLDPGAFLKPINQALGLAIERCGLALAFETPASAIDLPRAG